MHGPHVVLVVILLGERFAAVRALEPRPQVEGLDVLLQISVLRERLAAVRALERQVAGMLGPEVVDEEPLASEDFVALRARIAFLDEFGVNPLHVNLQVIAIIQLFEAYVTLDWGFLGVQGLLVLNQTAFLTERPATCRAHVPDPEVDAFDMSLQVLLHVEFLRAGFTLERVNPQVLGPDVGLQDILRFEAFGAPIALVPLALMNAFHVPFKHEFGAELLAAFFAAEIAICAAWVGIRLMGTFCPVRILLVGQKLGLTGKRNPTNVALIDIFQLGNSLPGLVLVNIINWAKCLAALVTNVSIQTRFIRTDCTASSDRSLLIKRGCSIFWSCLLEISYPVDQRFMLFQLVFLPEGFAADLALVLMAHSDVVRQSSTGVAHPIAKLALEIFDRALILIHWIDQYAACPGKGELFPGIVVNFIPNWTEIVSQILWHFAANST